MADSGANQILAALNAAELARLAPELEPVDLPPGRVLYEAHSIATHAYFPTTAVVSLLYAVENGASAEIAVVGHEGVVGVSLFMSDGYSPSRAVVQIGGEGFRLRAGPLKDEFVRAGAAMHLLLRYATALMTQLALTAVCNRHHPLDQQLCRSLLLSLDRHHGTELPMTQKLIADTLGVRRESVTEAALKLQKDGVIDYSRGHIVVLDRAALEARSCECYGVVKAEYDRLRPTPRSG